MSRFFEHYAEKRATEEGIDIGRPEVSPEYKKGEEKLNFQYTFSGGEVLNATEDKTEGGIASIIISKEGDKLFDFKDFLPNDCLFVTPTYLKELQLHDSLFDFSQEKIGRWMWLSRNKAVVMGVMNNPTSIFSLLHEIGHARCDRHKLATEDIVAAVSSKRGEVNYKSKGERDAWAEAIKMAREIRQKHHINLLEAFSNFDDLKKYVYKNLARHRYRKEYESNLTPTRIWRTWFGIKPDKEELDFLGQLFDKRKLVTTEVSSEDDNESDEESDVD